MTIPLQVLCIGSPFGDDAAGLLAARELSRHPRVRGISVLELDRPGASLLDHLDAPCTLVVDAVLTGAAPGTLIRVEGGASGPTLRHHQVSSHGFGLADALELAQALGSLPQRLILWGIEADPAAGPGTSAAVQAALPGLIRSVAEEIAALLPSAAGPAR